MTAGVARRRSVAIAIALVAASMSPFVRSAPDARAAREIQSLLAFVADSPCRFVRGGVEYPGAEARDHLVRKLEAVRSLIGSADAFVDQVASASSMTGEPYRVRCVGRDLRARDWLREELARMRRSERVQ